MTKQPVKKDFWEKFEDLMDSVGGYISEQVERISDKFESDNDNIVTQSTINGQSTSTIVQNNNKVVVKTVNGETTIMVNGKEYLPKDKK